MPTKSKPLICVACTHSRIQGHDYLCARTEGDRIDLVTGRTIHLLPRPCTFERSTQGSCGPAGAFWQAKKSPAS